jgi:hypothetical protein
MSITNFVSDFEIGWNKFNFVRLDKPDNIVAWKLGKDWEGWNYDHLGIVKAARLTSDILKRLNVWDKLDNETRIEMEKIEADPNYVINTRMEKAKKGRRNKYPNVPKEIACIECGQTIKMQASLLVKRAEKWANGNVLLTVFDFIKQFKCQSCNPSKGRKGTGKCKPTELICKCGNKIIYPMNVLKKRAEKKGITVEKLISSWVCQTCNPCHKGRPRKIK